MSSGGAKADDGAPAPAPEEPPVREPRVLPCVLAEFFSWVVVFEDACDALAELTAARLSYEAIELALLAPQEAEAEQLYAMHNALLRKAMPKHRAKRVTRQAWCEELAWCCVNLWHHVSGTERRIFLPEQGNEWAAYVALSAEQRAELLLGLCYLVMGQGEVNAEVNYWVKHHVAYENGTLADGLVNPPELRDAPMHEDLSGNAYFYEGSSLGIRLYRVAPVRWQARCKSNGRVPPPRGGEVEVVATGGDAVRVFASELPPEEADFAEELIQAVEEDELSEKKRLREERRRTARTHQELALIISAETGRSRRSRSKVCYTDDLYDQLFDDIDGRRGSKRARRGEGGGEAAAPLHMAVGEALQRGLRRGRSARGVEDTKGSDGDGAGADGGGGGGAGGGVICSGDENDGGAPTSDGAADSDHASAGADSSEQGATLTVQLTPASSLPEEADEATESDDQDWEERRVGKRHEVGSCEAGGGSPAERMVAAAMHAADAVTVGGRGQPEDEGPLTSLPPSEGPLSSLQPSSNPNDSDFLVASFGDGFSGDSGSSDDEDYFAAEDKATMREAEYQARAREEGHRRGRSAR